MISKSTLNYYSWPVGIVIFLLSVMTFNIWFLFFSLKVQREIVEPNPYEKGLDYERVIDELRRDDFILHMNYEISSVSAILTTKDGVNIVGARVIVTLTRPSDSSLDKQIDLLEITPGKYESNVTLTPGLWMARVLVQVEGVRQRREQTITIK